ncbi:beta-glucosidase family protein [Teredinibacter waterburyi]|uniref:beta-glucosidase family protein n=1 Tax=Teredinibacter waterburyi TaxID=1500538 RepID=UPI00165F3F43|nr:glycoside hydrolase family 3 N-terminal domain-containing protein [Teredinibacter waterburyi]
MTIKPLYLDSSLPVEARVEDLLARMTLEEKVGQMVQLPGFESDPETFIEKYKLGSYLHSTGDQIGELKSANQAQSRLNIPLIFGIDAIHGHCIEDETTVFPVQLALASTWNRDLALEMGRITAREAFASGLDWTFSPVLCLARDPRWGRTSETFGEDGYLAGEMAKAVVEGYQGAEYPFAACAKHFAAYGETTGGRDSSDAHISERQMRDIFLPPFERQVKAGCKTVMIGYQALNGVPCSANTWLLNDILRDEWGFDGVAVTDWNNVGQMVTLQHAAPNIKEAVYLCLQASNDMIMTTPEFYQAALELVAEGRISESRIDQSVRRILKLKFELGLFEPRISVDRAELLADQNRWRPALAASQQSLTLVKNEGILPLAGPKKILLLGDNADNLISQLGDWSFLPGPAIYTDTKTHRADTVTLRMALQDYCDSNGIELTYLGADVCGPYFGDDFGGEAVSAANRELLLSSAENADVVLFCAGDGLKQNGEFHDRADLTLTGNQQEVFDCLANSATPVVSLMVMSKPHCIEKILSDSAAVLIAFNPGAKGGTAITQCLFGEINPCGRLPISFPRHVGQLPVHYNQAPGWHAPISPFYDGVARYIDLPATPLLAFGEGMSYSRVDYGVAQLSHHALGLNELVSGQQVSLVLELSNNSERDAVEVVQLYCQLCIPGVTSPTKRLLAFERVEVAAGDTQAVTFQLGAEQFKVLDIALNRVNYRGEVVLMVGKSSRADQLQRLTLSLN